MATLHQHSAAAKEIEQPVTADAVTAIRQDNLQFPDAQTGKVLSDLLYFVDDCGVVDFLGQVAPALLPVPLTGEAEQSAKCLQGYFRVSPFEFADCPASTFFDRSIPYSSLRTRIMIS